VTKVLAVALLPGLSAKVNLKVSEKDTAIAFRSGEVPVLATPRLIALCEEATSLAVAGNIKEGCTTVGMRVRFDHLAPTRVGAEVTAEATLERVEGSRLTFTVLARDPNGVIGVGKVTRVVVEVERFLKKAH